MNDRIQELINQTPLRYNTHQSVAERREEIVKFAELIVRECMDVVRDINQEYDGGSTVVNAAEEIKEYFGIE